MGRTRVFARLGVGIVVCWQGFEWLCCHQRSGLLLGCCLIKCQWWPLPLNLDHDPGSQVARQNLPPVSGFPRSRAKLKCEVSGVGVFRHFGLGRMTRCQPLGHTSLRLVCWWAVHVHSLWSESRFPQPCIFLVVLHAAREVCPLCIGPRTGTPSLWLNQLTHQGKFLPEQSSSSSPSRGTSPDLMLCFLSYPHCMQTFMQPCYEQEFSAHFQLVFYENCSICPTFVGEGELHILYLYNLDPPS